MLLGRIGELKVERLNIQYRFSRSENLIDDRLDPGGEMGDIVPQGVPD